MSKEKKNLELSETQRKQLADHITEKTKAKGGLRCPVCDHNSFTVSGVVTSGMVVGPGNSVHMGGTTIPTATIVCDNCYHMLNFAAVPIGVLGKNADGGEEDV